MFDNVEHNIAQLARGNWGNSFWVQVFEALGQHLPRGHEACYRNHTQTGLMAFLAGERGGAAQEIRRLRRRQCPAAVGAGVERRQPAPEFYGPQKEIGHGDFDFSRALDGLRGQEQPLQRIPLSK